MDTQGHDDNDRYSILATTSPTLAGSRVLKHGDTFAVYDAHGDIRPLGKRGAHGLYHEGTRFLSEMRLRIDAEPLPLLSSTVRDNNLLLVADLTNPDLVREGHLELPHGSLHVLRSKLLWKGACHERIVVSSFAAAAMEIDLELSFAADFADVFEVRGTHRERRGDLRPPVVEDNAVLLTYIGLDGVLRRTRIAFDPPPSAVSAARARFRRRIEPRHDAAIYVTVECERADAGGPPPRRFEEAHDAALTALHRARADDCDVVTSNNQYDACFARALADLRMMITETPYGEFPYAGVPWYSAPFGRDAIITALESLWIRPELARGVLRFLAATQADERDPEADAEPGKIIHELRGGEMAALREIPFGRYYGSVDATPLFVVLADAYCEHSGDVATIAGLWSHIERALTWIERDGDGDGDGFVEYGRRSASGLIHQGWKDSHDAVFHADGSLAEGPIALCEVQGYVYAAFVGAARLAGALGRDDRARALRGQADRLRERFDEAFWSEELGSYVLALDGGKRPCVVRASNAGHCLFSGIALPERAARVAEQLLSSDGFSGWGIRTVAASERRYNPMSYHNGSIWPHDNALIAAGLARYGLKEQAQRVMSALFEAAQFADPHRLPELYCGFERRPGEGPTAYPVACSPQSWSAAAQFMVMRAVLGLKVEGAPRRVGFESPVLPPFLEWVSIRNLRVGAGAIDLVVRRYPEDVGIHVTGRRDRVEVLISK